MKRKGLLLVLGTVLGAAAGWLYWYYVGCASGTCAITSSPVNSSLYGALMGGLMGNMAAPTRTVPPDASPTDQRTPERP